MADWGVELRADWVEVEAQASVRVTKGFGASGVYSSFFRVMET